MRTRVSRERERCREGSLVQSGVLGCLPLLTPSWACCPLHCAPMATRGTRWAVPGRRPVSHGEGRCGCQVDAPAAGHPGVRPHHPLTFGLVQCKLEQQACLSSKQLAVRCEGPCPCPTEQATSSTTDGKAGNAEPAHSRGGGLGLSARAPGWLAEYQGEVAQARPGLEGGWLVNRAGGLGPQPQGACAVCLVLGSEGEGKRWERARREPQFLTPFLHLPDSCPPPGL